MVKRIFAIIAFLASLFFAYVTYAVYTVTRQYSYTTMDFVTGSKPKVDFPYHYLIISVMLLFLSIFLFIKPNNVAKNTPNKINKKYF